MSTSFKTQQITLGIPLTFSVLYRKFAGWGKAEPTLEIEVKSAWGSLSEQGIDINASRKEQQVIINELLKSLIKTIRG